MSDKTPVPAAPGGPMSEFLDLYGKAVDALIARAKTQEPFSPDLSGAIEPALRSLARTKETMLRTVREEIARAPVEARRSFDDQVMSVGAADLLRAAIAAGEIPPADVAVAASTITMPNGALRIPWLELIKEILDILLGLIPGVPPFLVKLIRELLRILDKIFGGMPHEDNTPSS